MAKRGINGVIMRAYGTRDHEVTVTGTEWITDHFLRVHMHAPEVLADMALGPAAAIRLWVPDLEDPEKEHQRGYTLAAYDEESGAFALDFVLHEPVGPASAWARGVEPGDTAQANTLGSAGFTLPDELPVGYLLVGDAASLPALNAIVATIPDEVPIELYLEQHDDLDLEIPRPSHPRLAVHWVPRRGATSFAAALEARDWSDWYVWMAPESGSMKHLRVRLRDEFGFPKSETHAQAYWYYGRAFGANRSKATAEPEAPAVPEPSVPESVMSEPTVSEPEAPPAAEPAGTWRSRAGSRLVAPLKRTLILAGVVQALITLLELAPFVLLVELARRLLAGESGTRLFSPAITALVLVGLGALLTAGLMTAMHRLDARFGRDLRERLLTKLSRLPLGWFDSRGSGAVKSLVQDDVLSLHYLVTHAIPDAVRAAVAPVAVLLYLFVVDWRLGLVLFLPVLAYLVGMAIMVVQSGPRTAEAGRWNERMNTEAGAYLEGQRVIRVFGGAASSRFRSKLDQYIQFVVDWQRPMSGQKTFIDQVTRPMTFLVLISVVGTALITAGWMDPVSLLPFLLLGTTFGSKLLGIGFGLSGLQEGLLAAKRIQVTLEEKELAVADGAASATASPADDRSGLVELDHVTFSYRPGVPVLEDVSLRLEPGTVTALVGPSGSGKSTLAALLARFHDVDAGTVSIGGSDVRDLSSEELYRRIGFVFQQTQLVQGSVRENIALARPDAADTEVEAAARAARIHERILRLPQGYATELGPDAALSGGERQRLCIARAILADTPVLVLDEATSFADPESEYQVQRALNALTTGRTVVVIAHRLHTVTGADQMIVLDDGRVAETGTHAALLEQDGRYRRLWEHGNTETHALVGEDR